MANTTSPLPTIDEMATARLVTCAADGCRMRFFLVADRTHADLCLDHADTTR